MNQKNSLSPIGLAFAKAPPASLDAGTELTFAVSATVPAGVSLAGAIYAIREGERDIQTGELPARTDDGAISLNLRAPAEAGEHRWTLTIETAPNPKGERSEGSLPFSFAIVPHATSLAVWDTPAPAIRGRPFTIKIGAKCTAGCALAGETVEVRDDTGKLMGSATLGDGTIADTASLYGAEVTLKAPRKLHLQGWSVVFPPGRQRLPHTATEARFTFMVAPEPAHALSVKIVDKKTKAPLSGAQVRLGVYRAVTGDKGSVKLDVAKGAAPLIVTCAGYQIAERDLHVSKDMRIVIAVEKLPEEDPFAAWTA